MGPRKVAQVASPCEAYGLPCVFSNARTLTVMYDKSLAKAILKEPGVPMSASMVVRGADDFAAWILMAGCRNSRTTGPSSCYEAHRNRDVERSVLEVSSDTAEAINTAIEDSSTNFPGEDILIEQFIEQFIDARGSSVSMIDTGNQAEIPGIMELTRSQGCSSFRIRTANLERMEGRA